MSLCGTELQDTTKDANDFCSLFCEEETTEISYKQYVFDDVFLEEYEVWTVALVQNGLIHYICFSSD